MLEGPVCVCVCVCAEDAGVVDRSPQKGHSLNVDLDIRVNERVTEPMQYTGGGGAINTWSAGFYWR